MKLGKRKQKFLINTITDALDVVAVLIGGSVNANQAKNKEEAMADLIDDLKTLLFEINNAEVDTAIDDNQRKILEMYFNENKISK
jgi:hypothetical protein